MSRGIHSLMQHSNDFNGVRIRVSKVNYMTALGKLSITVTNIIYFRRDFRGISKMVESFKQFANVGISLRLSPMLKSVCSYLSHVSVRSR